MQEYQLKLVVELISYDELLRMCDGIKVKYSSYTKNAFELRKQELFKELSFEDLNELVSSPNLRS